MAPLRQILIIGGTGDLSRRHLLPALTRLLATGELPAEFSVVVTGLEAMTIEGCRALMARELSLHAARLPAETRQALVERISYLRVDTRDDDGLRTLAVKEPLLVYVATPPEAVPGAIHALFRSHIHRSSRIVLDKPFGLGRASARALNAQLRGRMDEPNVYRVDHFLYHHAVQQLVRWRMQPDLLSLADSIPISQVEIIWDEERPVPADRSSYCGVLRDMIQSHLLQLAAILTMKAPQSMTHADLAGNRLDALRRMSAAPDDGSWRVRGRHVREGEMDGSAAEKGRETFATLPLRSQMPRWEEARFFLRAAKGVNESRRHIELRFASGSPPPSFGFVRLEILSGTFVLGAVGDEASRVEFEISADAESASTRLLRAALAGDDTFTLHPAEPEEAWRIVEPVLAAWEENATPLHPYGVGAAAADLEKLGEEPRGG